MRKYYTKSYHRETAVTRPIFTGNPVDMLNAYIAGMKTDPRISVEPLSRDSTIQDIVEFSSKVEASARLHADVLSPSVFYEHVQLGCLFKKFPFSGDEHKKTARDASVKTLLACESHCATVNSKFRSTSIVDPVFYCAKDLIYQVLGLLTPSRIMQMIRMGHPGPGATLSNKGNKVTPFYKFMDLPYTCTQRARPYAMAAISDDVGWMQHLKRNIELDWIPPVGSSALQVELMFLDRAIEIAESDRVTFVPKTVKTDRPIAVGASLNVHLQLGVKTYLEQRLKVFGVDLTDQTKNQRMAREGSRFSLTESGEINPDQFSTIDLESASDTISFELVKALLPSDWFAFLCDLRHETGQLGTASLRYEKFCAMGNGFTFPLESLIFWALTRATLKVNGHPDSPDNFAIYGDDIIVRYRASSAVIGSLEWYGFKVNHSKTYLSGPFKESCGSDYLEGHPVRPFYLKRQILRVTDVYHLCNALQRKWLEFHTGGLRSLYELLTSSLKKARFGPLDCDDSALAVPLHSLRHGPYDPYTRREESARLGLPSTNLAVWFQTVIVPKKYKADQACNLWVSLRQSPNPRLYSQSEPYKLKIEGKLDGRYVTRRQAVDYVTIPTVTLNWDGWYSRSKAYTALLPQSLW